MAHIKLILASRSPRRYKMLSALGYEFTQINPPYDDPPSPGNGDARLLARTTAERKARSTLDMLQAAPNPPTPPCPSVILCADTIAITDDGRLVGTPQSRDQAHRMIQAFTDRVHTVVTAVSLIHTDDPTPQTFDDTATVRFGQIDQTELASYVNSEKWSGKAGAYNLEDRLEAGWPIQVTGDPTTVMGLPMRPLRIRLETYNIVPQPGICS